MLLSESRYTPEQYKALGYSLAFCDHKACHCSADSLDEIQSIVFGQFKNVIKVLFSSTDGSLDFSPTQLITENTPDSVRTFLQNFLFQNVQAARSAPDDATALDLLIPRSVQTTSELAPYMNTISKYISDARQTSNTTSE